MMKFDEAKSRAEKEMPDLEIKECIDIGDKYAFSFGIKGTDEIPPGTPIICVSKENGAISEMTIPPLENLDILEAGKEITLK